MIHDFDNEIEVSVLQKAYKDLTDQYREAWCQHLEKECEMIDLQLRFIYSKLKQIGRDNERQIS